MQATLRPASRVAGTRRPAASSRRLAVRVMNANVLIANSKGGGHAFIGLYLAKELLKKGHRVTILNDGDKEKLLKKAPFSKYADLERQGLNVVWGNPANPATYPRGNFDVVYDNNGKDMESCKPLIDTFKGKVDHYVFVASAGAYKADPIEPMHVEGDARKSSAGHVEVEKYLEQVRMPYTVFQPLYIYGPHTAKDCEQWVIDRVIRDRPVPIPAPGIQLTSVSHVEDVASMLAAVPGNKKAIGEHYNVCSDRTITFVGMVKAVGKALGKEPEIVLYDPEKVGTGKSGKAEGFPFRTVHFFASADKAKRELGWKPAHTFLGDVKDLVRDYIAQGRDRKEVDFSIDNKILAALGKSVPKSSSSSAASASRSSSASKLGNWRDAVSGGSSSNGYVAPSSSSSSVARASSAPRRDLKIQRTVVPTNWREELEGGKSSSSSSYSSSSSSFSSSAASSWRSTTPSSSSSSSSVARASSAPRRDLKIQRTVVPSNWREELEGGSSSSSSYSSSSYSEPARTESPRSGSARSKSVVIRRTVLPKDWRSGL